MHNTESRIVTSPSYMRLQASVCAIFSLEILRAGAVKGLSIVTCNAGPDSVGSELQCASPALLGTMCILCMHCWR